MAFADTLIHSVDVFPWQAGADDTYGGVEDSFDTPVTYNGRVFETTTDEFEIDRDTRTVKASLLLAPDAVIGPLDEVEFNGNRYRVDGEPRIAYADAAAHHIVANLLRIEAG